MPAGLGTTRGGVADATPTSPMTSSRVLVAIEHVMTGSGQMCPSPPGTSRIENATSVWAVDLTGSSCGL